MKTFDLSEGNYLEIMVSALAKRNVNPINCNAVLLQTIFSF